MSSKYTNVILPGFIAFKNKQTGEYVFILDGKNFIIKDGELTMSKVNVLDEITIPADSELIVSRIDVVDGITIPATSELTVSKINILNELTLPSGWTPPEGSVDILSYPTSKLVTMPLNQIFVSSHDRIDPVAHAEAASCYGDNKMGGYLLEDSTKSISMQIYLPERIDSTKPITLDFSFYCGTSIVADEVINFLDDISITKDGEYKFLPLFSTNPDGRDMTLTTASNALVATKFSPSLVLDPTPETGNISGEYITPGTILQWDLSRNDSGSFGLCVMQPRISFYVTGPNMYTA